jgi:hypothetical protein
MNSTGQAVRLKRGCQSTLEEIQLEEVETVSEERDRPAAIFRTSDVPEEVDPERELVPLWQKVADDIPPEKREKLRSSEIKHRAGTAHLNADAMSQCPHPVDKIHFNCTEHVAETPLPDDRDHETLRSEQLVDPDIGWFADRLQQSSESPSFDAIRPLSGKIKTLVVQWPQFVLKNELLYRCWLNTETEQTERLQFIPSHDRK